MILAVDFDGVLVSDQFPQIGHEDAEMVKLVKLAIQQGHEVCLWTCRIGDKLGEALVWCHHHGIQFSSVNSPTYTNLKQYGTDPRKVYADYYIDDHSIGYSRNVAIATLNYLLEKENAK